MTDNYDRWHDGGPVDPELLSSEPDTKEMFIQGDKYKLIPPDDQHFGKRLRAAIEALPDEMRNDPAYADPIGWVKRARENNYPPGNVADEEDNAPLNMPASAIGVATISDGKGGQTILEVSITDPVYAAKIRDMSVGGKLGYSIGYKPPMVIKQNRVQVLFSNARALVRRLFKRA